MSIFFNYNNPSYLLGQSSCPFSNDPTVSSLKELLIFELKQIAYYITKLDELSIDTKKDQNRIIQIISTIASNTDLKRSEINKIIAEVKKEKIHLEKSYMNECLTKNIIAQPLKPNYNLSPEEITIANSINEGEYQTHLRYKILSEFKKHYYEIIMNLIENCSLYLIELDSYGVESPDTKLEVIKLLNITNFPSVTDEKWFHHINEFVKTNYRIMKKMRDFLRETFSPIEMREIDTSIKKGPAILVSGHFFRDLVDILNATENQGINVYTHNGMILAHSSKLAENYPHLVGHYQRSSIDAVLDVESFPGPILMTRNSQINRNIIRGRIFTTNEFPLFGISKIENSDFSEMIKLAKESMGFTKDIELEKINVGYREDELLEKLNEIISKIKNGEIKRIILIDLFKLYEYKSEYLEKFLEMIPDDYYVISLSYAPENKENVWHINSFYSDMVVYKIVQALKDNIDLNQIGITLLLTQCNMQTISYILNFKEFGINDIHIGNCCPLTMSPGLIKGLKEIYGVKYMTSDPAKDFEHILPK